MVFLTCTPWSWTSWGRRDSVSWTGLREHQVRVRVGADLEDHRDRERAVTRRLAADVVHVLDAVDRLFERRGDGTGNVSAERRDRRS